MNEMQIYRVLGDNLNDALKRAQAVHGADAKVLRQEALPGGGVSLSVTAASQPQVGAGLAKDRLQPVAPGPARRPRLVSGVVPIDSVAPTAVATPLAPTDPGLHDLERRLMQHGTSARWAKEIARAVGRSGARGMLAIDAAADVIAGRIKIAPSPKIEKQPLVVALVGATGVGKTTALAKLAVQLTRARRRVSLVTLDQERVGGVAQLQAYGELLKCSVDSALNLNQTRAAIERRFRSHVILLDTPAINPRDPDRVRDLGQMLAELGRSSRLLTYAVIAATTQRSDVRESLGVLRQLRPAAGIITKLDETRRPGAVLECAARGQLPLVFLTTGRDAASELTRPTGDHCADLLLRGRVA